MVIHNYLIPIALFVELEMQKFLSSMFFSWDSELYDPDRDLPARCNTSGMFDSYRIRIASQMRNSLGPPCHLSDINEELGLVTHLFSDKTGTLTQNVMEFRKYCKEGAAFDRESFARERWDALPMVMTLCHSVQVRCPLNSFGVDETSTVTCTSTV